MKPSIHNFRVKLTRLGCYQVEVGIAQATFEVVDIVIIVELTVFPPIEQKFIVIVGVVKVLVVVISTGQRCDDGQKKKCRNENAIRCHGHGLIQFL